MNLDRSRRPTRLHTPRLGAAEFLLVQEVVDLPAVQSCTFFSLVCPDAPKRRRTDKMTVALRPYRTTANCLVRDEDDDSVDDRQDNGRDVKVINTVTDT
jgi:hypothetical protein